MGQAAPSRTSLAQRGELLGNWSLPAVAAAPSMLRQRLRSVFALEQLPAEMVDSALVIGTELVTNAVDHAGPPILVRVRTTHEALRVEVRDGAGGRPRLRPFDPRAGRGRGLQMVDALSDRWSWASGRSGKIVWAEMLFGEGDQHSG